jgi:hypothetical protein
VGLVTAPPAPNGCVQLCTLGGACITRAMTDLTVLEGAPLVRFNYGPNVHEGFPHFFNGVTWTVYVGLTTFSVPPLRLTLASPIPTRCVLPGCGKSLDPGARSCWMCGNPV